MSDPTAGRSPGVIRPVYPACPNDEDKRHAFSAAPAAAPPPDGRARGVPVLLVHGAAVTTRLEDGVGHTITGTGARAGAEFVRRVVT